MAPFLTHLVVGERLWAGLAAPAAWAGHYGTFLLGCLAPDVDKFSEGLAQATTHFVAKDRNYAWVRQRTRYFLEHQGELLRAPFAALDPAEQAFVGGYLCHVATDEVTGRYGRTMHRRAQLLEPPGRWVDAFLTAFDPQVWAMACDPARIVASLETSAMPGRPMPFVPEHCLAAMLRIVWPQVRDGGGLDSYLAMVRRHRYWHLHGRVSDACDDAELEAGLAAYGRAVEQAMPAARQLLAGMDLKAFVTRSVSHSRKCLVALLAA